MPVEAAHSILGASNSPRWDIEEGCPGSVQASQSAPPEEYDPKGPAAQGTAAHELGEQCIEEQVDPEQYKGSAINGFTVDDNMIAAVRIYVQVALQRIQQAGTGARVGLEARLDLSWIHPLMFGTNDLSIYWPAQGHLDVIDYKHGYGVVEPSSLQLKYYGIGTVHELEAQGLTVNTVSLTIVQPRADHVGGPVRSEMLTRDELMGYVDRFRRSAENATSEAPLYRAGKHCRWCPARGGCVTLKQWSADKAKSAFPTAAAPQQQFTPAKPEMMTAEEVALIIEHKGVIESWLAEVVQYGFRMLERGHNLPGHKVVEKRGKYVLQDESKLVQEVSQTEPAALPKCWHAPKLKSRSDLTKVLPKTLVDKHFKKETGGRTLAPLTDPRSALAPMASEAFPIKPV